jgi:Ca2+-transporting ATPase
VLQAFVVHVPFLNEAFGTVPLSAAEWLLCGVVASSVLWAEELRKVLTRASSTDRPRAQRGLLP